MMVYTEVASISGRPWVEIHSALGYFGEMTASRASTVTPDSIPLGHCVSWRSSGRTPGFLLDAYATDSADGGKLTLTGPGFADAPLDDDDDWYYGLFSVRRVSDGQLLDGNAQYVYTPGEYTLRGTGGYSVGALEAKIQMPEFLIWTNKESVQSVDRTMPLEVTWTGGGPNDRIIVQGGSAVMVGGSNYAPDLDVGSFICAVAPTSKSFTLPAAVLKLLPVSASSPSAGTLIVAAFADRSRATFKPTLMKPATDAGYGTELGTGTFGHLMMITKAVSYQ